MPISVICPTCAASIKAPESMAGQSAKCPKCKESIRVPPTDAASVSEEETQTPVATPHIPTPSPLPVAIVNTNTQFDNFFKAIGMLFKFGAWGVCLLVTIGVTLSYSRINRQPDLNAVQQAAAAADACFWIIGAYIVTRAITSMTRL